MLALPFGDVRPAREYRCPKTLRLAEEYDAAQDWGEVVKVRIA